MSTALVIEDAPEMRDLLEGVLTRMGFDVVVATNGLDGIKLAQALQPALIILDLMMPLAAGDFALGFFRSTVGLRDIPVIVTSAHPNAQKISEQLGAQICLEKPFDVPTFKAAVTQLGFSPVF